jgi:hypothetical protein
VIQLGSIEKDERRTSGSSVVLLQIQSQRARRVDVLVSVDADEGV